MGIAREVQRWWHELAGAAALAQVPAVLSDEGSPERRGSEVANAVGSQRGGEPWEWEAGTGWGMGAEAS